MSTLPEFEPYQVENESDWSGWEVVSRRTPFVAVLCLCVLFFAVETILNIVFCVAELGRQRSLDPSVSVCGRLVCTGILWFDVLTTLGCASVTGFMIFDVRPMFIIRVFMLFYVMPLRPLRILWFMRHLDCAAALGHVVSRHRKSLVFLFLAVSLIVVLYMPMPFFFLVRTLNFQNFEQF